MKPTGRAEPRFDIDYAYGRQAELQIGEFIDCLAKGNGQVEVKRKRFIDLCFYVETYCDKGRKGVFEPSGILVTTAKTWAFTIDDLGLAVLFPTELIRLMLNDPSTTDVREDEGSCPTRGKLINLASCLYAERKRRNQRRSYDELLRAEEPPSNLAPVDNGLASGTDSLCIHKPEYKEHGRCWICDHM